MDALLQAALQSGPAQAATQQPPMESSPILERRLHEQSQSLVRATCHQCDFTLLPRINEERADFATVPTHATTVQQHMAIGEEYFDGMSTLYTAE